jgi:hypothetical protein
MEFIDIHPLDLGALLIADEDPVDVIVHQVEGGGRLEHVEYRGKFYRQTVEVPVTSEYGKRILSTLGGNHA